MDIAPMQASKSAVDALFDNTALIDMTPDAKPAADMNPSAATPSASTASAASSASSPSTTFPSASFSPTSPASTSTELARTVQPTALSAQNRADTTAKHVGEVLESLDFAAVRLEGAMYRIGYLESQVDTLQEQLKVLPEFRARAAKAILTERENRALLQSIHEYEEELKETHELLEKLNRSRTWQFFRWMFGISL